MARPYQGLRRKKIAAKPLRNKRGFLPMLFGTGRRIKEELVPRVENLVAGGVIAKPIWFDVMNAHPPTFEHRVKAQKPHRFEWREDDRLRRTWQHRNPEASMHPKVLFLDETQLPAGTRTEHPADTFVRRQQSLMRKGLSEEEAYRRVLELSQQEQRGNADEVAAARAQASALGASPAEGGAAEGGAAEAVGSAAAAPGAHSREGFAARLLRRFAEEARESGQPFPKHWFLDEGRGAWQGVGDRGQLDKATKKAFERTARQQGGAGGVTNLFGGMSISNRSDFAAAAEAAEAAAAAAEEEERNQLVGDKGAPPKE